MRGMPGSPPPRESSSCSSTQTTSQRPGSSRPTLSGRSGSTSMGGTWTTSRLNDEVTAAWRYRMTGESAPRVRSLLVLRRRRTSRVRKGRVRAVGHVLTRRCRTSARTSTFRRARFERHEELGRDPGCRRLDTDIGLAEGARAAALVLGRGSVCCRTLSRRRGAEAAGGDAAAPRRNRRAPAEPGPRPIPAGAMDHTRLIDGRPGRRERPARGVWYVG